MRNGDGHRPVGAAPAWVVCGDPALAARVAAALGATGAAARTAARVEELELGPGGPPPLVVLAVDASPTARIAAIRAVRESRGDARIVACHRTDGPEVRRAIRAGADGYVLRDELERTLAATVAAVMAGQVAVPRARRMQVVEPMLSPRERQVLAMAVSGHRNDEIAGRLVVAESTVKSHLSAAFLKLGVRSRAEAAELLLDRREGPVSAVPAEPAA